MNECGQINYKLAWKKHINFRFQSPILSDQKGKGPHSSATLNIPRRRALSTALTFLCQLFSDSRLRSFITVSFVCVYFFHLSIPSLPKRNDPSPLSPNLTTLLVILGKLPLRYFMEPQYS